MAREYVLTSEWATARIHKTDDVWFMYLTDYAQTDEQFIYNTLKSAKEAFSYHVKRLERKNSPKLEAK